MGRIKKPYTLIKRGNIYYYRTYDAAGFRTSAKSTGCTSKLAATQFCENLYLTGSLNKSRITFAQYANGFYNDDSLFVKDRSRALSWNTVYHYRLILNNKLIPYFGNMALTDITYSVLKTYRVTLSENNIGPAGINFIFTALSNILKTAYLDDLITNNPVDKIDALYVEKGTKTSFTLEQIKSIANTIVNYKNFIIFLTLTGMRASEALGITEDDFKVSDKGTLFIDLNKQFDTRQRKYTPCKWNSSRKIPVIPELKNMLTPHVPYTTVCSALQEAKVKLNLKEDKKAFHAFRHFFISDTKSKNYNPLKIEYLAGHKMKGMELVYTHLDFEQMIEICTWQKEILEYLLK